MHACACACRCSARCCHPSPRRTAACAAVAPAAHPRRQRGSAVTDGTTSPQAPPCRPTPPCAAPQTPCSVGRTPELSLLHPHATQAAPLLCLRPQPHATTCCRPVPPHSAAASLPRCDAPSTDSGRWTRAELPASARQGGGSCDCASRRTVSHTALHRALHRALHSASHSALHSVLHSAYACSDGVTTARHGRRRARAATQLSKRLQPYAAEAATARDLRLIS